ncbi:MAG: hypothetical protein LIR50_21355 [Bacillota bacterium]|nr:hypothetical protein [Bacillota bacterium]
MALSNKALNDKLREVYLSKLVEMFSNDGEEVLRTGSNEIALPVCDEENNDKFVVLTVKVPTGSREGDLYDGYSMAEDYKMKLAEKAEKNKEAAKRKAAKIERDKKQREQAAAIKAKKNKGDEE